MLLLQCYHHLELNKVKSEQGASLGTHVHQAHMCVHVCTLILRHTCAPRWSKQTEKGGGGGECHIIWYGMSTPAEIK